MTTYFRWCQTFNAWFIAICWFHLASGFSLAFTKSQIISGMRRLGRSFENIIFHKCNGLAVTTYYSVHMYAVCPTPNTCSATMPMNSHVNSILSYFFVFTHSNGKFRMWPHVELFTSHVNIKSWATEFISITICKQDRLMWIFLFGEKEKKIVLVTEGCRNSNGLYASMLLPKIIHSLILCKVCDRCSLILQLPLPACCMWIG